MLTFFLQPYISHAPTGFFALAVLVCSLRLGMGPALASALLSVILAGYFFMEPLYSFHVDSASNLMQLVFLLVIAITVSSVSESKHRLERILETILVLRGFEPRLAICNACSRIQGFKGEWLSLADIVKRSGVPLVMKSCPKCQFIDGARIVVPFSSDGEGQA
jgi:hypothetical protein